MALGNRSLLLYGLEVTTNNRSIDFKAAGGGPEIQATLTVGFYSLQTLADEIAAQLNAANPVNVYTVTVDRTVGGGTSNRMTITTGGAYLSLLFLTGTRSGSTAAPLLGYNVSDYTGATSYLSASGAGTALTTDQRGYTYLPETINRKVFGAVNVAASGLKEAVVFQIQRFIQVEYKYEPASKIPSWTDFMQWAIQQRFFDFTPDISDPATFYVVTLESTALDKQGLGFQFKEMLPSFPNFYQTGPLNMRVRAVGNSYL